MKEEELNEKLREQIKTITERKGINLTEDMVRSIIKESYFLRSGGGISGAKRVPDVSINDISPKSIAGLGDGFINVLYSSQKGSIKDLILNSIKEASVQDWYRYAGDDTYEEYFGEDFLNKLDEIDKIVEDMDDVNYTIELDADVARWGCSGAKTVHIARDARKKFIQNIISKKGISEGVLFLMLEDEIYGCFIDDYEVDTHDIAGGNYELILKVIEEYYQDNTIVGIDKFISQVEESNLSQSNVELIKNYGLKERVTAMIHQEEKNNDIVPGHPQITMDDIKKASKNRNIGQIL